jgi:hypothetical protein
MAADLLAQTGHPSPAFVFGHMECIVDCGGDAVLVVGIDKQRVGELRRGPGELAEDEDSVAVGAAGDELLGHQIHAVAERRYQRNRRRSVEGRQPLAVEVLRDVVDRVVSGRCESTVDPADHLVHRALDLAVLAHRAAGGCGDLHQANPAAELWVLL